MGAVSFVVLLVALIARGDFGTNNEAPGVVPTALATGTAVTHTIAAPSPTSLPTITPRPTPPAGRVLYQADTGEAFAAWDTGFGWRQSNGLLVNDGSYRGSPWLTAPYQPEGADYAVEAEIRAESAPNVLCNVTAFAVGVRIQTGKGFLLAGLTPPACQGKGFAYVGVSTIDSAGSEYSGPLALEDFQSDIGWHTYRVEVEGNTIRFLIDGRLIIEAMDHRNPSGGLVGLWSDGAQLYVRRFTVIAL